MYLLKCAVIGLAVVGLVALNDFLWGDKTNFLDTWFAAFFGAAGGFVWSLLDRLRKGE